MENVRFFSRKNAVKKALPFIFVQIICSALAYLYLKTYFNLYELFSAGLTLVFFAALDFISKHKKIGFFVYAGMMAVVFAAIDVIMAFAPSRIEFIEWFMTGAATIETNAAYMLSLMLFFTFFISSAVYYFTHLIYRVSILTLLAMIPCAVFIKASQPVPAFYAAALAAVDVLLYLYHYKTSGKAVPDHGKAAALTGYADFAAAALLVALLIPKPQETPYYEKFEQFSSWFSFSGSYGRIDGSYTEHSGNADLYNQMEKQELFVVNVDTPEYYKVQVYDSYDSENRWWFSKTAVPSRMCRFNWQNEAKERSLSKLANAYLEYLDKGGQLLPEDIDKKMLDRFAAVEETVHTAYIKPINYPSVYLLAPERTIDTSLYGRSDVTSTRRTDLGEIMTDTTVNNAFLRPNEEYSVDFYGRNAAYSSGYIESGLCNMSAENFYELLIDMINCGLSDDSYSTAFAFLREYNNEFSDLPSSFAGFEQYDISEEMRTLSASITEGLTYDYEKAEAIEAFFNDGSFSYDLGYRAPTDEDTPEFFVTESKRGTCSDFATAFCLLAKAAGLNVHYVEGFNSGEVQTPGVYSISTENAHAFPEVYIAGAGWTIYEPTVSGSGTGSGGGSGNENNETDYAAIFATSVTVVTLGVLLLMLIILMPTISEKLFILRVKHSDGGKAVIKLYNRLSAKLSKHFKTDTKTFTPRQLSEFIAAKTDKNAEDIITPFEQACYGGQSIAKEAADKALEEYLLIVRSFKKIKKQP